MVVYTKETKPSTNYSIEEKLGIIWKDADFTWASCDKTWAMFASTSFTKESKSSTNYNKESKS